MLPYICSKHTTSMAEPMATGWSTVLSHLLGMCWYTFAYIPYIVLAPNTMPTDRLQKLNDFLGTIFVLS